MTDVATHPAAGVTPVPESFDTLDLSVSVVANSLALRRFDPRRAIGE